MGGSHARRRWLTSSVIAHVHARLSFLSGGESLPSMNATRSLQIAALCWCRASTDVYLPWPPMGRAVCGQDDLRKHRADHPQC